MKSVRAQVSYANALTEEWEHIADFEIKVFVTPNWSTVSPTDEALQRQWHLVPLPNGEEIELNVFVPDDSRQCNFSIRQGREPVAHVMAEGSPSLICRTLANASVQIDIFIEECAEAAPTDSSP